MKQNLQASLPDINYILFPGFVGCQGNYLLLDHLLIETVTGYLVFKVGVDALIGEYHPDAHLIAAAKMDSNILFFSEPWAQSRYKNLGRTD